MDETLLDKTRIKVWAGEKPPKADSKVASFVWSEVNKCQKMGPVRTVSPYFQARAIEHTLAARYAYDWYGYYGEDRELYLWTNRGGEWESL